MGNHVKVLNLKLEPDSVFLLDVKLEGYFVLQFILETIKTYRLAVLPAFFSFPFDVEHFQHFLYRRSDTYIHLIPLMY